MMVTVRMRLSRPHTVQLRQLSMSEPCAKLLAGLVGFVVWLQPLAATAALPAGRVASSSEASPPAGAIILFNGRNLEAWLSQKDRQWEESDGPADWKILKDE